MSSALEQRLRATAPEAPEPDPALEAVVLRRVYEVLPRPRGKARTLLRFAAPAVGLAAIAALLVAALPRGTDAPSGRADKVLRIAGADPTAGLFDPVTSLADLRGRVVVMAFGSTSCGDCRNPFGTAYDTFAGQVTFVQVIRDVSLAQGRRISENRLPEVGFQATPVAIDPDGALAAQLEVTGEPTVLVLNRAGDEVARFAGSAGGGDLEGLLPRLIEEPPPAGFPRARPARPELAVFTEQPPADINQIPPITLQTFITNCQAIPGSLRLAATGPGGLRLWVAKTMDGDIARATSYGSSDHGGGVGCGAGRYEADRQKRLARIQRTGVVSSESGQGPTSWSVSLVLLDGWTEVRIGGQRIAVRANGAITTGPGTRPRTAIISGPNGTRTIRP